jgi:hypothetical protein
MSGFKNKWYAETANLQAKIPWVQTTKSQTIKDKEVQ